ncbi:helix-turn-helix domain-containing protein [Kiloniella sp.]|uniref:helix-turn-helix domain-containing protein n=1 Tax=Kiloniella sp. TaxID=1938587 RepID=UPI003A8FE001
MSEKVDNKMSYAEVALRRVMPGKGQVFSTNSLGELIRVARDKKGVSRVKLAKFIGASLNSMVKYEKAGEEGGQYPPLPKLAKICELLNIDPRNAFNQLIWSNDVEVQVEFDFVSHFEDEKQEYTNEETSNQLKALEGYLIDITDRMYAFEEKLDQSIEPKNGPEKNSEPS